MNLDTAERAVFGHDEDATVTISEAVQASTALPGFYNPARIRGVDYVDGGVRRTANIDVAIEHGADLIICYNPFRPFSNRIDADAGDPSYFADGRYLSVARGLQRRRAPQRRLKSVARPPRDPAPVALPSDVGLLRCSRAQAASRTSLSSSRA